MSQVSSITAHRRAIKMAEVMKITGYCRATIYNKMAAGQFPRQHRIPGTRMVRWSEAEVLAWVDRLFASREEQRLAA